LRGDPGTIGFDWLLLHEPDGGEALVLTAAIGLVRDLGRRAQPADARSLVMSRLGVVSPLRAIARDRAPVRIWLRDSTHVTGTPERVGADHLDLVAHDADEIARPAGRGRVTVPFAMLALVRRAASPWADRG
jgi:hypothetical protein